MLAVSDLHVSYGAINALSGVTFRIPKGAIVTLIGGNGAGKTTTLRTISGLLRPKRGTVTFKDEGISNLPAHAIVSRGLCHVPEGRMVFSNLSVDENLAMGAYLQRDRARIAETRAYVFSVFPRLQERLRQVAGTLSGGEQQMLAIGRALMARPRFMMIDELSLGLMPKVIDLCYQALLKLRAEGMTVLLVEQNTERVLSVADDVCVLESGQTVWKGAAADARNDPALAAAFLGLH